MLQAVSAPAPRQVSLSALIGAGFVAQILSIFTLWPHQSVSGDFLGRYSTRYAIVLVAHIVLLILWAIMWLKRDKIGFWLRKLSFVQNMRVIVFSGAVIVILWFLPVEPPVKQYVALNWLLVTALLIYIVPDRETGQWGWVGWFILALLFIPTLITVLTSRPFSPDEAQWADYASSAFQVNGIYARTWLQEPVTILPGLGWSVAGYGWVLENVAFDIKVGRLWNFYSYVLAFVGIGAVTWRLYGRQAAAFSVIFAALSPRFVMALDYRPDHQLPAAAMLITFAALQGRYSKRFAGFWHFLCGLTAVLSMELHAAGIVFAFGFALFYVAEFAIVSFRQKRIYGVSPLIGFGIGALIGTMLYYQFNIQPVGGIQTYLQLLTQSQDGATRVFRIFNWPSLFEAVAIAAALGYIAWRRAGADRLFLGILVCVIVGIVLFVAPQYPTTYDAFYVVPVGVLVTVALSDIRIHEGKSLRRLVIGMALVAMLATQRVAEFIAWPTVGQVVQTGELPSFLFEELKPQLLPFLQDNDIVASTHQLIWTIPHHPQLVSVSAELTVMNRWNLTDPADVWEQVKPTVIVYVQNQMTLDTGLDTYLNRHHFIVCKVLNVLGQDVTVFRQTCPAL